jgi:hypothetical protein
LKFVREVQLNFKYEAREIKEDFILEYIESKNHDIDKVMRLIHCNPDDFLSFIKRILYLLQFS